MNQNYTRLEKDFFAKDCRIHFMNKDYLILDKFQDETGFLLFKLKSFPSENIEIMTFETLLTYLKKNNK